MRLAKLRQKSIERQVEWDPEKRLAASPLFCVVELAGEVGELANVVKKLERERLGVRGSRATREQLIEELADVIICADLVAMAWDVDLEVAVRKKFNAVSDRLGLATRMEED